MRTTNFRTIGEILGGREPGAQAAASKLFASTQHQRLLELATEILAEDVTVVGDDYALGTLQRAFLLSRAETIYGGSSQIQRNIIGERLLGLPKEPRPLARRGLVKRHAGLEAVRLRGVLGGTPARSSHPN